MVVVAEMAPLIDEELIVATLLRRDLPTVTIAAELDPASIDDIPMLMFMATSGDQARNGPGLWATTLTLDIFTTDPETGWLLCADAYAAVHKWSLPGGSSLSEGYVNRVVDLSMFTRVSTQEMQGKNVIQYTATFDLMLRNR